MTVMLVETTEGHYESKIDTLHSVDKKEICKFLKGNLKTMGFTIQYAVNHETNQIIEIVKSGKMIQRDIKPLIELGFTEWMFSWSFAAKRFKLDNGEEIEVSETLDLMDIKDVLAWGDVSCFKKRKNKMVGKIEIETEISNSGENQIHITNEAKVQMYAGDRGTPVWATVSMNSTELKSHILELNKQWWQMVSSKK